VIPRNRLSGPALRLATWENKRIADMKGIIAWLLGVPIVVIILLYLVGIF